MSPLEKCTGETPLSLIGRLHTFGCMALVHQLGNGIKMGDTDQSLRAVPMIFIGYEPNSRAWRFVNPVSGRIVRSIHATFRDNIRGCPPGHRFRTSWLTLSPMDTFMNTPVPEFIRDATTPLVDTMSVPTPPISVIQPVQFDTPAVATPVAPHPPVAESVPSTIRPDTEVAARRSARRANAPTLSPDATPALAAVKPLSPPPLPVIPVPPEEKEAEYVVERIIKHRYPTRASPALM